MLVFWSRDPDGTQHNQGDSPNALTPGINGPTTLASIRNADADLGRLRAALKRLGLEATTDIVVTADHGFSVTSKASATSPRPARTIPTCPEGELPPGFLALDLAARPGPAGVRAERRAADLPGPPQERQRRAGTRSDTAGRRGRRQRRGRT